LRTDPPSSGSRARNVQDRAVLTDRVGIVSGQGVEPARARTEKQLAPSYRISRLAWAGLALTLIVIAVVTVVGGALTRRATDTVQRSSALAAAFVRADEAVAAEVTLRQEYRLTPSPDVRAEYATWRAELFAAMDDIDRYGSQSDRRVAASVRDHRAYLDAATERMFNAVDAGDAALAGAIEHAEIAPVSRVLDQLIDGTAETNATGAQAAVAELRRVHNLTFVVTIVAFGVGVVLAIFFALLIRRYQRDLVEQAERSRYEALHDRLTGLPNRGLFTDRIEHALAMCRRNGESMAVMLLDLDRFKEVNDTLGHHYGDELLRCVAARLREVVRETDTVARLSGDEFAVLLQGADQRIAGEVAERALRRLHQNFTLNDTTVDIEISVGVAIAPTHADNVTDLIRCADLAMYTAKDAKTGVVFFDPASLVQQPNRLMLLGDLRRALEHPEQLMLAYQPKIGLDSNQACGVEALIRWKHPERGWVSPGEFIPVAESTGLINRLTAHVLAVAIAQIRDWCDAGYDLPVAVNLSPRCLLDVTLVDRVRGLLDQHGVPARLLRLEVTETAVMANPALAMDILTGLHALGVRLSIDDYGTGYSSMAYLKRLPVDELKVDRSFVLNMTTSDNDAVLVRSAIDLGHNLGLTVVAEGVELAEHVAALHGLGCDIAQGYHYARPMPAAEIVPWIREQRPVATRVS
jgi:diguanylate cyclase